MLEFSILINGCEISLKFELILGGILLDENPLKCDCDLIWISDWMKRLISDMRVINIEAALQANSMAAMSQCIVHKTNHFNESQIQKISLLDLRSEDIFCGNISPCFISNSCLIILLILITIVLIYG